MDGKQFAARVTLKCTCQIKTSIVNWAGGQARGPEAEIRHPKSDIRKAKAESPQPRETIEEQSEEIPTWDFNGSFSQQLASN